MKRTILLLLVAVSLIMLSCSGKEEDYKDKTPPANPTMRPHLGDTGDPVVSYLGQDYIINEENNGIDTVPDEDWLRIMWEPFIDTDLSHVKVYRFDQINAEPVLVDSIQASAQYYLDSSNDLNPGIWYSYFIDLVDFSGNVATSDTVSYALLSKSIPFSPPNGSTITSTEGVFQWYTSGVASKYRLLLMDELGNYVGHQDLDVATEENPLQITMPNNLIQQYSGRSLRWRVDAFEVDGNMNMQTMGSESNEMIVHIQ